MKIEGRGVIKTTTFYNIAIGDCFSSGGVCYIKATLASREIAMAVSLSTGHAWVPPENEPVLPLTSARVVID